MGVGMGTTWGTVDRPRGGCTVGRRAGEALGHGSADHEGEINTGPKGGAQRPQIVFWGVYCSTFCFFL